MIQHIMVTTQEYYNDVQKAMGTIALRTRFNHIVLSSYSDERHCLVYDIVHTTRPTFKLPLTKLTESELQQYAKEGKWHDLD